MLQPELHDGLRVHVAFHVHVYLIHLCAEMEGDILPHKTVWVVLREVFFFFFFFFLERYDRSLSDSVQNCSISRVLE